MLNNITLCGRICNDLELKKTTNSKSVTSFTIAVDRDYSGNGEKKTDFINVIAWGGTAEFICRYFCKGKLIILNGSLQVDNYEKDGQKRTSAVVNASNVWFAGDKATNGDNTASANTFTPYQADDFSQIADDDSDLPF